MAEEPSKMSTSTNRVQAEAKMFSATSLVPGTPGDNPFSSLPWPSPGDRIKSEDFRTLSQSLRIIHDVFTLSATFFGRSFGEVKLALATQQLQIQRVMSVFGAEIGNMADSSLDNRKVIQVIPAALGERQVLIVLTEAVDTRRFAPELRGLTYSQAADRLRNVLGDVALKGSAPVAPKLVGLTLAQGQNELLK